MQNKNKKFLDRNRITQKRVIDKKKLRVLISIYFAILFLISGTGLYEIFSFATPPENEIVEVHAEPLYLVENSSSNSREVTVLSCETDNDEIEEDYLEEEIKYDCNITGYLKSNLNVRKEPSLDSDILDVYKWNTEIKYAEFDSNWVVIEYDDTYAYLYKAYISDKKAEYKSLLVEGDKRKSFMDYKAITSKRSKQYKLQATKAYTAENGVRAVNSRYCIALGSYYSHQVGQYIDVVLENGTVIPCIVGDCKKNIDTDGDNKIGNDGGAVEFVVSTSSLNKKTRRTGDVSYSTKDWNSKVVEIRVYNYNVF